MDLLKIIQLGLTFFNKDGELPEVEFPIFIIKYYKLFGLGEGLRNMEIQMCQEIGTNYIVDRI